MDLSKSNTPRPSGLPRPSRLPRPSPSIENLKRPAKSNKTVPNPHLRTVPSREQLSTPKPRAPIRDISPIPSHDRNISTGTVIYSPLSESDLQKPSDDTIFKKPQLPAHEHKQDGSDWREQENFEDEAYRTDGLEEMPSAYGSMRIPRGSRPSLSERTMETLQNIPSSPAVRKRGSSFFSGSDSPMRPSSRAAPSSRPGSSDSAARPSIRSISSRPASSSGSGQAPSQVVPLDFRASTNTFRPPQTPVPRNTSAKSIPFRPLNAPSRRSMGVPALSSSKLPSPTYGSFQQSPSPVKNTNLSAFKSGSKTVSARTVKPRPSVSGLFRKPSLPSMNQSAGIDRIGFVPKKKTTTLSNTSSEAASTSSRVSRGTSATSVSGDDQDMASRKSSLALRDQIAKAKAAKRAALKPGSSTAKQEETPVIPSGEFDFGLTDDPFNQRVDLNGSKGLLRKRINAARLDGRLNIAAMRLKEIPQEVMNMYSLESIDANDGSWAEAVDLTRLVAADNELEALDNTIFPDIDLRESTDDDDAKGNQFGGLETLDLHGNMLTAVPIGLRRLELLTSLNLSNNKLGNDSFEVISQIPSLRDLKLAGNALSGILAPGIGKLQQLEVLDLRRNTLTTLPEALVDLVRLRVFNIAENKFASLPFKILSQLPLVELVAAKNNLTGTLVNAEIEGLAKLQVLDVTSNSLTSLAASSKLHLPALHQLNCSSNRLIGLPDMASWVSLLTLTAEDNNISTIPEDFALLTQIKNVDFSGNNIKILDDRIGGMESLDIFRISGNPLREKKFSSLTTEELKRTLKARMEPLEPPTDVYLDDARTADGFSFSLSPSPSAEWSIKAGGVLDRSNTQSYSLNPVTAAQVAANNMIRELQLQRNSFKEIPSSIGFFAATLTTLNMSHNELNSHTFFKDDLELPVLKELNLSSNTFNSIQPIIQRLKAPQMEKLDISFNRLTSLPVLKAHFPSLVVLLASNNTIRELSPETVKGLKVLDCSSNDINSLNARIGLLGGPGGLEKLDVSGNRFRVPKYTILEKGTEATLAWLRDRIPASELNAEDANS
ncbi:hypothetical protein B7494_g4935 [Chlorociboria aeruginascens]|nr:hypothetical protein B7494_g4935 [Chlorociboria aeruginascens]